MLTRGGSCHKIILSQAVLFDEEKNNPSFSCGSAFIFALPCFFPPSLPLSFRWICPPCLYQMLCWWKGEPRHGSIAKSWLRTCTGDCLNISEFQWEIFFFFHNFFDDWVCSQKKVSTTAPCWKTLAVSGLPVKLVAHYVCQHGSGHSGCRCTRSQFWPLGVSLGILKGVWKVV